MASNCNLTAEFFLGKENSGERYHHENLGFSQQQKESADPPLGRWSNYRNCHLRLGTLATYESPGGKTRNKSVTGRCRSGTIIFS